AAVVPASIVQRDKPTAPPPPVAPAPSEAPGASSQGTVILDVEQGGIEVPSFLGKSLRSALDLAQESGLQISPVGSGTAREQSPAPGSHVAAGATVVVKFGR